MACESGTSSRPTCTPILFPDIRNWPNARARRFTSAEARGRGLRTSTWEMASSCARASSGSRFSRPPGHPPESICLVVTDEEKSSKPWAVFTGDTLFIGDVGRPDLSKTLTPAQLAGKLYDSLHEKLLTLPDDVLVYPAHGAGSLCGRNMRAERSSTIGTERLTNYALQIRSRDEFVRELTAKVPVRPEYFLQDAEINREGAAALSELPRLEPVSPEQLRALLEEDAIALDVRPGS